MVNVQCKENGKIRYENLLSEKSVEDFVESIKQRGCTYIEVTSLDEIRKTVLSRVDGRGFENNSIPKKVLERNVMDIITDREWDFDDCCDFVENASKQTLMDFLKEYDLAEDGFEDIIRKYMSL